MSGALRARSSVLAGSLASLILAGLLPGAGKPRQPVTIQILAISDWRAQLDPIANVGGAAILASYFNQDRLSNPNTLTFAAGGSVGASPPISRLFDDEPAIQAMRLMGFDADTLGNHNFEAGLARLQRQINLAGESSGVVPGNPFVYVCANLRNLENNLDGVDKMALFHVNGIKVAVIGIINPNAPILVRAGSFGSIEVTDAIVAANKTAAVARKAADVVVGLVHLGVSSQGTNGASGALIDFAKGVTGFDLILGGDETDTQYSGTINGALVVQNRSRGLGYSRAVITFDPASGVVGKSVAFVTPVANAVTPDATIAALLESYRAQLVPILSTVIGSATRSIPQSDSCGAADGRLCESLVGNTVTDEMRTRYGVDFAITNSGGLRADLTCPDAGGGQGFCPPAPPSNRITRGQALAVLPFNNVAATVAVTGVELKAFLENGISTMPASDGRFPQVSGLCFSYDISAPVGSRVTGVFRQGPGGSCTSTPVNLTASATYTVAINDFMAGGGDGYPVVAGRAANRDPLDQMLVDYVISTSPLSPAIQGRIVCTDSNPADGVSCPVVVAP